MADIPAQLYGYAPLRRDKPEIRLFDLDPWTVDNNETIELRMTTRELKHAGDYICLSYAWGDTSSKHGIKIDGQDFDVGENLYGALLRLRRHDSTRRLWVDAICINQNDIAEREAQVSVMQHIYHSATEVIAWIGEDNGASDERGIDFLYQLSSRSREYYGIDRLDIEPRQSAKSSRPPNKETLDWIESVTPLGLVGSHWLDLTALLSRPWFSRIWIVQEVVMGKEVTVCCGRHMLKWMDIYYCALYVNELARVITGLAAPKCIQVHDPDKGKFFFQSRAGYKLFLAMENIDRVGYLVVRKHRQRVMADHVKPAIDAYIKLRQRQNEQPGHLWGSLSPDLRTIRLVELAQHLPGAPGASQGSTNLSTPLQPPLGDPRFIDQYLPESDSACELVVSVDGKIPIYTTTTSTATHTGTNRWGLWKLINRFRSFGASDPRDKIYALVGLATDVEHITSLPSISYQVDVFEAFWELITAELRGGGRLGFLSDASCLDSREGFPSWIPPPEFSLDHWTPDPFKAFECEPHILYRAAGNTTPRTSSAREKKLLTLSGAFVGRIEKIGGVYDRDADITHINAIRTEWANMIHVGKAERLSQRLIGLAEAGFISEKEMFARFHNWSRHNKNERSAYEEFLCTLLASVSKAGENYLNNLPQEELTPTTGHRLPNGQRAEDRQSPSQLFIANRLAELCHGRRFFVCDAGNGLKRIGLAPRAAQVGDEIALFLGGDLLYITREAGTSDEQPTYWLVGDAYVHGWMGGELQVGSSSRARAVGVPVPLKYIDIRLR